MALKVKGLKKIYKTGEVETHALRGVDLEINEGEVVVILGQSGSGKSTLLNCISGLDTVTSGTITVDDQEITSMNQKQLTKFRRDNLGFIFQQYNLLPNLTLEENIEVGANLAVKGKALNVNDMIESVGLTEHIGKTPTQLSGGQQQRVSIARALVKNPKILFCDEPTGALDEDTGKAVLRLLQELNTSLKTTLVIITHNPSIAEMADTVIKMNSGNIVETIKNKNKKKANEVNW